ncbi:hypothetical protein J6590_006203 [Homalodisca vitripennis]|nr:hypothetical protein J6590_006203 [Homalodisca vitripennis]
MSYGELVCNLQLPCSRVVHQLIVTLGHPTPVPYTSRLTCIEAQSDTVRGRPDCLTYDSPSADTIEAQSDTVRGRPDCLTYDSPSADTLHDIVLNVLCYTFGDTVRGRPDCLTYDSPSADTLHDIVLNILCYTFGGDGQTVSPMIHRQPTRTVSSIEAQSDTVRGRPDCLTYDSPSADTIEAQTDTVRGRPDCLTYDSPSADTLHDIVLNILCYTIEAQSDTVRGRPDCLTYDSPSADTIEAQTDTVRGRPDCLTYDSPSADTLHDIVLNILCYTFGGDGQTVSPMIHRPPTRYLILYYDVIERPADGDKVQTLLDTALDVVMSCYNLLICYKDTTTDLQQNQTHRDVLVGSGDCKAPFRHNDQLATSDGETPALSGSGGSSGRRPCVGGRLPEIACGRQTAALPGRATRQKWQRRSYTTAGCPTSHVAPANCKYRSLGDLLTETPSRKYTETEDCHKHLNN